MNKQMEMGKTMFEVMKMRKNNKQNPFPLRKYYGAMIIGFVFFLGIMAYYRQNRKSAWKKNRSELITAQHRKKQKQQRKTRKKQRQRHK